MAKELVISATPHETKVALLEEGRVVELSVEREKETGLVGSIYKGRVTRVLPGMQSAFVNIGLERDAFLYVSDYFEEKEEYERVLEESEEVPPTSTSEAAAVSPGASDQAPSPPTEPSSSEALAAPAAEPVPSGTATTGPSFERPRLGRRSHRGRRRGRRGGRGPGRGRFPHRPPGPPVPAPPEGYEPVILPGESLAKYRDRISAPPPQSVAAPEPESEPVTEVTASTGVVETIPVPLESVSETTQVEAAQGGPEEESLPAATLLEETSVEERTGVTPPLPAARAADRRSDLREAVRRRRELDYIPVAEVDTSESAETRPETPTPESETPEAPEDFGHRATAVEEENGQVALPPSVRERTAGGVEWERPLRGRRRGRRMMRGARRRRPVGAPRPRAPITELLQPGQETIVQIAKEQIGTKGARITSHVTLPGRFVVYMPTIEHVGVSRRIHGENERQRLRRLLLQLKASVTGGIVVRTAAEAASDADIRRDLDYLVTLWRDLKQRAEQTPAPVLLHRDLGLMERILRDQLTTDFDTIWIDNEEEYTRAIEFISRFQPSLVSRVKLYTKEAPIFEELGVQREIDQALRPKVWLKSGGYIVINHTEALVAIDVNTGKFVGKGSSRLEDTIVRTNLDAVHEIVRQIRLRDLGGIIIIDFIDMEDPRNRRRVMQELERALRSDRAPSKTLAFNEFGLIAITRKRVRQSLEKVLCQPCPYCTGTGMMKSLETLCYEIQEEARKMARSIDAPELTIRAHPEVAKALKSRESGLLRELEEQTGKNIIIQPDQTLHVDQYNIF